AEHDVAQIHGRVRHVYISPETVCIYHRKISGMVNVCMCDQYEIQLGRRDWQRTVLIQIRSLFHSAVYQKLFPGCLDIIAAAGYLMCCPQKCDTHASSPLWSESDITGTMFTYGLRSKCADLTEQSPVM